MKKDKELLDQELGDLAPFLRDLRGKGDGFRISAAESIQGCGT